MPDKVAALLGARSGPDDSLNRVQNESGCKANMSREQERVVTLNGSRESVNHAKELLQQICAQHGCGGIGIETISCVVVPQAGNGGFPPYQEIMVPGSKVGLVIGKGGETIKMLQEKTGAKMVIIQEGPGQEAAVRELSRTIVCLGLLKQNVFYRRNRFEFRAIHKKLSTPSNWSST